MLLCSLDFFFSFDQVIDADGSGTLHVTELVQGLLKIRGDLTKSPAAMEIKLGTDGEKYGTMVPSGYLT